MTSKAAPNRSTLDPLEFQRSRDDANGMTVDEPPMSFQRRPTPSNGTNYSNSAQRSSGGSSSSWSRGTDRFRSGPSSSDRGVTGGGGGNRSGYERSNVPTNEYGNRSTNFSRQSTRDSSDAPSERSRLTLIKRTTEDSIGKVPQSEEKSEVVLSNTDESIDVNQGPEKNEDNHDMNNKTQRDSDTGLGRFNARSNNRSELKVNSRAALFGDASFPSRDIPNEDNMGRREKPTGRDFNYTNRHPPVLNERFAKLGMEEKDKPERESEDRRYTAERGPPPAQQSSRFMKAIEADDSYVPPSARGAIGQPPSSSMIQNSRFAAASAERQADMRIREDRRGAEREIQPVGPPPVPSNTRFAAAYAELESDRERGSRDREERRPSNRNRDQQDRFHAPSGYDGQQQGRFRQDRGGRNDENRGRYGRATDVDPFPSLGPLISKKTEFIRPEMPKHLQPKKEVEPVLPPISAPLTLPGEDEEAARARIEKKKREAEEKVLAEKTLAEELAAKKAAEQALEAEKAVKAAAVADELLSEFSSGKILGSDLATWCKEQGSLLPSIDRLLFHMLQSHEKKNPDPACPWAEKVKYGTALLSLVEDNIEGQVRILWGIQKYCDKQGFPKIGGEYLIQAMFRAMYKYDLVDSEGFSEWKEDDTAEHEAGKIKSVVQTIDWFNWLQEEDEDDDYEEDDE